MRRVIADGIQSFVQNDKVGSKGIKHIHFVKVTGSSKEKRRYDDASELGMLYKENGWNIICLPVDVGGRGCFGQSLMTCLRTLGLGKQRARTVVRKAADEPSFWIWTLRKWKDC